MPSTGTGTFSPTDRLWALMLASFHGAVGNETELAQLDHAVGEHPFGSTWELITHLADIGLVTTSRSPGHGAAITPFGWKLVTADQDYWSIKLDIEADSAAVIAAFLANSGLLQEETLLEVAARLRLTLKSGHLRSYWHILAIINLGLGQGWLDLVETSKETTVSLSLRDIEEPASDLLAYTQHLIEASRLLAERVPVRMDGFPPGYTPPGTTMRVRSDEDRQLQVLLWLLVNDGYVNPYDIHELSRWTGVTSQYQTAILRGLETACLIYIGDLARTKKEVILLPAGRERLLALLTPSADAVGIFSARFLRTQLLTATRVRIGN